MVAPIDYTLQGVQSPFQSFLQAAQVGAGLSQAQLQRQQFKAQMAQQQQEADAKAAQQTELQQLQAVPLEQMTQPQMLRLAQLTGSEATRAYLFRAAERIPAERQTGLARNYGSTIIALVRNPEIGVKRLETLAEAEQDPEQKKALTALIETAKVDPLAAAKWGVDMMDMGGGKFSEVGQALRKALGAEFGVEGAPVKLSRGDVLVTPTGRQIAAGLPMEPATPSEIQQYELAKREGFKGTFFDFKRQLAEAGRAPAAPREPAAPTITQIQDPADPMRMITIDARRYQGGSVGAPGVIGASGKTVKAEADALKREQAQSDASAILDTLKTAYNDLDRMRAIPSEQRGMLSNVLSGVAATGVGQAAGRMTGTQAQTQRDIIASARNQLFAAVKNATGLSAQNLNSNVEFTTWLNSLTDPSRSIESNRAILDNMERFIASGGKYSARTASGEVKPAGAPPAPRALTAEDRQALDWANKNPTDPRAAQIKQRLGM